MESSTPSAGLLSMCRSSRMNSQIVGITIEYIAPPEKVASRVSRSAARACGAASSAPPAPSAVAADAAACMRAPSLPPPCWAARKSSGSPMLPRALTSAWMPVTTTSFMGEWRPVSPA
eukprot:scaffold29605_cov60-Phaeocystis_antarctica.AAC.2